MGRKFAGLGIVAAMAAVVCLSQSTNRTDDDAFGSADNAKAQCGGGGGLQSFGAAYSGCSGGGGLQSFGAAYSSCSGGGDVGGGLQYAPQAYYSPAYYAPAYTGYSAGGYSSPCGPMGCPVTYNYYQPRAGLLARMFQPRATYAYASGPIVSAPITVAPPRTNIGLFNVNIGQASPPVPLRAGESYVAGSLRRVVSPSNPVAGSGAARTVASSAQLKPGPPAPGLAFVQITQDGLDKDGDPVSCQPCKRDQREFAAAGVPLKVLNTLGSDAEKAEIARLLRGIETDMEATPFYVITLHGLRMATHEGAFRTTDEIGAAVRDADKMASRELRSRYLAAVERNRAGSAVAERAEPSKDDTLVSVLREQRDAFRELADEIRQDRASRVPAVSALD